MRLKVSSRYIGFHILEPYMNENLDEDAEPTYTYRLGSVLSQSPMPTSTLALIKRGPTLDPLLPLSSQLNFLNLSGGDETPYESIHAMVSCGVKPWFEAFVGSKTSGKDVDGKMGTFQR